jgi:hypothetical protein
MGALTKSKKSASGWLAYKLAALHVSMTEPPPTATYTSYWPRLATAIASLKLHVWSDQAPPSQWPPPPHLLSDGSTRTVSYSVYGTPAAAIDCSTAAAAGSRAT